MFYTKEEARAKWPGAIFRAGAVIGDNAVIGDHADITTVCSKYVGNIVPMSTGVLIRIGCETHTPESWLAHGDSLAEKHNETEWWQGTGHDMLAFLSNEARRYEAMKEGKENG